MSDLPPAGWQTDPEDPSQYRYWDGTAWTDHRAPKSDDVPDSAPAEGRPLWKSPLFLGAAALLLIILFTSMGDDPDSEPAVAVSPSVEAVEETSEVETAADEPAPTEDPEPQATTAGPAQHRESRLACGHFRNTMRDASDGVLTDEELREKLREIDENAAIATPRIQQAAREMFGRVTSGTVEEFTEAVGEMHDACTEAGW